MLELVDYASHCTHLNCNVTHFLLQRPTSANPNTKSGRQSLLNDISGPRALKKVVAPEQRLIMPEAIGSEVDSRYAQKTEEE